MWIMYSLISHRDPVQKRMTFLHFFTSFQNFAFCEILWLTSRKKITRHKWTKFSFTEKKNTTIFIFWDFLMFYQIFLSPQVKQWPFITSKYGISELPRELPNDLGFNYLGNIRKLFKLTCNIKSEVLNCLMNIVIYSPNSKYWVL